MIIRIFQTAVEPDDVERGKQIFRSEVKPVFDNFEGCHGIDLLIGVEEHSRGYVDVATMSRWDSLEDIRASEQSPEYQGALGAMRELFRQTPLVHHFTTE